MTVNTTGIHVNSTLQLSTLELTGGTSTLVFTNATSNWLQWNTAGVAAPAFTTRSSGTKMVLYPLVSGSAVDYALGVEGNHMWYSVPTSGTDGFKWYTGTTNIMTANAAGLNLNTRALSGVTTAAMGNTTITGFANVSSTLQVGGVATFAANANFDSGVLFADAVNNRVGVNTTTPGSALDVRGVITGGDGTIQTVLSYTASAGVTGTTSNHPYVFYANNAERMRVAANGFVGIGASSPGTSLEVAGGIRARGGAPGALGVNNNGYSFNGNSGDTDGGMFSSADGQIEFYTDSTEKMRIVANGNVGIATSSPSQKLTVQGAQLILPSAGWSSGQTAFMYLGDTNNGVSATNGGYSVYFNFNGHSWNVNGSEAMRIDASRNVGIGTTTPGYKLEVNGSFAATTKSFVIDHPTKPGMKLRYGSLEGPENGVYVRGRLRAGEKIIQLPDYWEGLVDQDTYTVNLTPVGKHQELYVEHIASDYIIVGGENVDCFYTVFAERNDVEKLEVEF